ncbi:hypothetical protein PanWU01x14_188040 [Parasponia andersonii]|uniref:Uncharacterized protein n=1 Tax=Parasponia andersonii TaxID=3476 RepID=A0A2P5C3A2_PARAD|nr:hypothetical protein PanWU01x14_188040 [Parasponia andersonii]
MRSRLTTPSFASSPFGCPENLQFDESTWESFYYYQTALI